MPGRRTMASTSASVLHGTIDSDVVELTFKGRSVKGPIFAVPGHPNDVVTVHLGYGRSRSGNIGTGPGFNAYAVRTSDALWSGGGLQVSATDETFQLACTQYHHLMEGRGMVRAVTRDEFLEVADLAEGVEFFTNFLGRL